jgi:NTP pyrophosphatase (non-canonical NTP hydrolase)
MDIAELQVQARRIRETYAQATARRYGRSWTSEEYMLGFLGDVGDLAKLVQGKAGVRPRDDLDEALAHELADCLWSILTLADCYDVDLEAAFTKTMQDIADHLDSLDVDQPLD